MAALPASDEITIEETVATTPGSEMFDKGDGEGSIPLRKIFDVLCQNLSTSDRGCRVFTYQSGFKCKDASQCLASQGLTDTLEQSLDMIEAMIKAGYLQFCEKKSTMDDVSYESEKLIKLTYKIYADPLAPKLMETDPSGRVATTTANVHKLYKVLTTLLPIRDRQWALKTIPQCFVSGDLIDCLTQLGYAKDISDAVRLGQSLLDHELIVYAEGMGSTKKFRDADVFWRFVSKVKLTKTLSTLGVIDVESGEGLSKSTAEDFRELDRDAQLDRLRTVLRFMKTTILPSELIYHGKAYVDVFSNADVLSALLEYGLAQSREEAAYIGQSLLFAGHIIHSVDSSKPFILDETLFFKYTTPCTPSQIEVDCKLIMPTESELMARMNLCLRDLRQHVEIKDRTYHLRSYKKCFLASEAVESLIASHLCYSVEHAVMECQRLNGAGKIVHVVDKEKPFADGKTFWRFVQSEDESSSAAAASSSSFESS